MNDQTIQVNQRAFDPQCTGYDTNNPLRQGDKVTFGYGDSTGPRTVQVTYLTDNPDSGLFEVSSFTVTSPAVEMTVQVDAEGEYEISTQQQGTPSVEAPMTAKIKVVARG
ncbi:MAG: hypothetical protein JNL82_40365 [Myxococcales bacterium]|nr:hypothetical protein [Myxococcales bacterium]